LTISRHPFPDHHPYCAADLAFAKDGVLLMTEKDAVKCAALTRVKPGCLPVDAEMSSALIELVLEKIRGRQVA
jgi:tetraacyldisaccharide 4'-kinase